MCGIVGYVGDRDEAPQMVLARRAEEARVPRVRLVGYRRAPGWADLSRSQVARGAATLARLATGASTSLPASRSALGHTRWATHGGGMTEANAHPHLDCDGRFAVIHNGIIENHAELRHCPWSRQGHTLRIADLIRRSWRICSRMSYATQTPAVARLPGLKESSVQARPPLMPPRPRAASRVRAQARAAVGGQSSTNTDRSARGAASNDEAARAAVGCRFCECHGVVRWGGASSDEAAGAAVGGVSG